MAQAQCPRFVLSAHTRAAGMRNVDGIPSPPGCYPSLPHTCPPTMEAGGLDLIAEERPAPIAGEGYGVASRTLPEEIAALRKEFARHSEHFVTSIVHHLEAIDARLHGSEVPQELVVTLPNGPAACEGTYVLVDGPTSGGLPMWKKTSGPRWIYAMNTGKWGIGGESEKLDNFAGDGAYVFCPEMHFGRTPDKMTCVWKRNNPAWTFDGSIRIEAKKNESSPHKHSVLSKQTESPNHESNPDTCSAPLTQEANPYQRPLQRMSLARVDSKSSSKADLRTSMPPRMTFAAAAHKSAGVPQAGLYRPTGGQSVTSDTALASRVKKSRVAPSTADSIASEDERATQRSTKRRTQMTNSRSTAQDLAVASFITSKRSQGGMFANAEEMKEQLHKNLHKKAYSVDDCYKRKGIIQKIARSTWLEYTTLAVIIVNAFWIGWEIDQNTSDALPDAPPFFQVIENLFCSYFTFEMGIRFAAFMHTWDALLDPHFAFDSLLLVLMIFETWVSYLFAAMIDGGGQAMNGTGVISLLRMLRLTRMVRLVRLFRALPELMVLLKGMTAASRSVGWTMSLLVIIMYVFAIAFRIITKGTDIGEQYFSSIPAGMVTLMLPGLLPDNADPVFEMGNAGIGFALLFMLFIVVAAITVMNMLIGVMCESVSVVASVEKEQLNVTYVKTELQNLMYRLDQDHNGVLSRKEIEKILLSPAASKVIAEVGVDVDGLVDVAEFHLFNEKEEITFPEFLELVLQLRGNNGTTVRDIVNLRKFIMEEMWAQEERLLTAIFHIAANSQNSIVIDEDDEGRTSSVGFRGSTWVSDMP
mmetsp:Transcript_106822/g.276127  ORF Transcript_106822/g.276127 Transcript_106822/m.276127 type:complete len:812 (-) Transcript_106822:203-2638(-)